MSHSEYRRIVADADTAVLFLHGILGTPRHFDFLLPHVPEGWSVVSLLLDGHGAGVQEFSRTSMARWQAQVRQEVDTLLTQHKRLVIAAHSMGTLFAIQTAIAHPDRVAALFLLAVPIRIRPRMKALTPAVRIGLSLGADSPLPAVASARNACSITPDRRVWRYAGWAPRYVELFRTIREVADALPSLAVPTLALQSDGDELVSPAALRVLGRCPAVSLHRLPHSTHYAYDPVDQNRAVALFREMLGNL